jgi:TDG/mug DNA glycosylase family protein
VPASDRTTEPGAGAPAEHRPGRAEQLAAASKTVPDVIGPGLRVLFSGINPSLYSAAVGHHFARPGNRFWPAIYAAGFTDRLLSPFEDGQLLRYSCGVTNLVARATGGADELEAEELAEGGRLLQEKVARYGPAVLAVLGVDAYRRAFRRPSAGPGRQDTMLGAIRVWVLPNPSGRNAHYGLADLAQLYRDLRTAAGG